MTEGTATQTPETEGQDSQEIEESRLEAAYARALYESMQKEEETEEEYIDLPEYTAREIPERSDLKVYREVMKIILERLSKSDAVKKARHLCKYHEDGYDQLERSDKEALFTAFRHAREYALHKVKMSDRQRAKIEYAAVSQFNLGLKTKIMMGAEPEAWMIVNPKLRKVDFMSSQEILRRLKNSLNLKVDLDFLREEKARGEQGSAEAIKALEEYERDNIK